MAVLAVADALLTMKTCFKCLQTKELAEFYRHSAMADGYLGKCKECTKADARTNRASKIDYFRAYDKARKSKSIQMPKKARATPWREEHPDWSYTHRLVRFALRRGEIQKQPCWVCGRKAVAHHADYSRPLDVVWLCESHHRATHSLLKTSTQLGA